MSVEYAHKVVNINLPSDVIKFHILLVPGIANLSAIAVVSSASNWVLSTELKSASRRNETTKEIYPFNTKLDRMGVQHWTLQNRVHQSLLLLVLHVGCTAWLLHFLSIFACSRPIVLGRGDACISFSPAKRTCLFIHIFTKNAIAFIHVLATSFQNIKSPDFV